MRVRWSCYLMVHARAVMRNDVAWPRKMLIKRHDVITSRARRNSQQQQLGDSGILGSTNAAAHSGRRRSESSYTQPGDMACGGCCSSRRQVRSHYGTARRNGSSYQKIGRSTIWQPWEWRGWRSRKFTRANGMFLGLLMSDLHLVNKVHRQGLSRSTYLK
ncbi:hypothetical protein QQ045_001419 [Rhodiola kirilowii]